VCPICKKRLTVEFTQTKNYKLFGDNELTLNRNKCWICGGDTKYEKKYAKKLYYKMSKVLQVSPNEKTDVVHKKCWNNEMTEEKNAYNVSYTQFKKYFSKR
jgi:hypothetical protein